MPHGLSFLFITDLFSALCRTENVFISAWRILAAVSPAPSVSVLSGSNVDIAAASADNEFEKFITEFHHVLHFCFLLLFQDPLVSEFTGYPGGRYPRCCRAVFCHGRTDCQ